MLGALVGQDSALNKLTRKISSRSGQKGDDELSEHADLAYMPDQKHIVKDTIFFYFSQSGADADFQKRCVSYIQTCTHTHIYAYTHTHIHMYMYILIYMCVCIY